MSDRKAYFGLPARILHWLMAAMIVAMLSVGAGMVSTVSARVVRNCSRGTGRSAS
jgi:cytochrome b561